MNLKETCCTCPRLESGLDSTLIRAQEKLTVGGGALSYVDGKLRVWFKLGGEKVAGKVRFLLGMLCNQCTGVRGSEGMQVAEGAPPSTMNTPPDSMYRCTNRLADTLRVGTVDRYRKCSIRVSTGLNRKN